MMCEGMSDYYKTAYLTGQNDIGERIRLITICKVITLILRYCLPLIFSMKVLISRCEYGVVSTTD